MNRDDRQSLGIERWKSFKGKATCLYPTGFGKTRVALKCIQRILVKNKTAKIIIIVPTDYLKQQWLLSLAQFGINANIKVLIVHSAIKMTLKCDFLIVDEVHMMVADTFKVIFEKIKYNLILCLTGTLDRLDGKEIILKQYAPVCDIITLEEAIKNEWVADYKQYKILIDVDLTEYKLQHKNFLHYFSYFDFDFATAMSLATDYKLRIGYSKRHNVELKVVTAMAMGFMRSMQARKNFIYNHPKKIEIANKIINAKPDKKIITFTKSKEHAKLICCGDIYHGSLAKKKKESVMANFNLIEKGVLNSCKALDVGADIKGVDTVIIISGDSSSIVKKQRVGRAIRKEGEKVADVWQIVIRGTVEEEWYRKSSNTMKSLTIAESQLDYLLKGDPFKKTRDDKSSLLFRF